jgi:NAD kinase
MAARIVLVTRMTRLEELIHRFNTREQARFYIEHMGLDFGDYEKEHATYRRAVDQVVKGLEGVGDRQEQIERSFLPAFLFRGDDLVVAAAQDGLVVNIAKYLDGQAILAVNPDPDRWLGVLLPFRPVEVARAARLTLAGRAAQRSITMAEATLNDGQRLLAVNDFLIGARTHVSARYRLSFGGRSEEQSSSGVLVATGAGSTGWFSSMQNMASALSGLLLDDAAPALPRLRLDWEDPRLIYVVREPYASTSTGATLCAGVIPDGGALRIESHMAEGGVIFSDGIEADALAFNAGAVATVRAAARKTRLIA